MSHLTHPTAIQNKNDIKHTITAPPPPAHTRTEHLPYAGIGAGLLGYTNGKAWPCSRPWPDLGGQTGARHVQWCVRRAVVRPRKAHWGLRGTGVQICSRVQGRLCTGSDFNCKGRCFPEQGRKVIISRGDDMHRSPRVVSEQDILLKDLGDNWSVNRDVGRIGN